MIDRERAEAVFREYTSGYDLGNAMIWHKMVHTLRVASNCERIAVSLGLDDDDTDFAWLLGLLHDIGRFEQVRRYGTFVDASSVDHAGFGADLLFGDRLIETYPIGNLSEDRLALLETAIRLHNRLNLPEGQDDRTQLFCNLIRDADKVDIFRVVTELSFEERIGTSRTMLETAEEACEEVMACVYEHRCVPRGKRRTRFEGHIANCCMAFELVFPESRRITSEQGFLRALMDEYDRDGNPLWNERERAQIRIVRRETEAAWGEAV